MIRRLGLLVASVVARRGRERARRRTGRFHVAAGGRAALTAEYNQRFWLQDRQVEVLQGEQVLAGRALGVADDGALILEQSPGQSILIRHGDVSVLSIGQAPRLT